MSYTGEKVARKKADERLGGKTTRGGLNAVAISDRRQLATKSWLLTLDSAERSERMAAHNRLQQRINEAVDRGERELALNDHSFDGIAHKHPGRKRRRGSALSD